MRVSSEARYVVPLTVIYGRTHRHTHTQIHGRSIQAHEHTAHRGKRMQAILDQRHFTSSSDCSRSGHLSGLISGSRRSSPRLFRAFTLVCMYFCIKSLVAGLHLAPHDGSIHPIRASPYPDSIAIIEITLTLSQPSASPSSPPPLPPLYHPLPPARLFFTFSPSTNQKERQTKRTERKEMNLTTL